VGKAPDLVVAQSTKDRDLEAADVVSLAYISKEDTDLHEGWVDVVLTRTLENAAIVDYFCQRLKAGLSL